MMWTYGGHPMNESVKKRFLSKVAKFPNDPCWYWIGYISRGGYGRFGVTTKIEGKKSKDAHRVSWELHFGAIPKGLYVCHRCDVRACVNPKHLFLGTNDDNMKDMIKKGRCPRGTGRYNSKLSPRKIKTIKKLLAKNIPQAKIASCFKVSQSLISNIKQGKTWKHI